MPVGFKAHGVDGAAIKVKIEEGTQSGRQFKIKGKGMPVLRSRDFGEGIVPSISISLSGETIDGMV